MFPSGDTRVVDVVCLPFEAAEPKCLNMICSNDPSQPHSNLCLDGNFEQKRCQHAGSGDQPVPKPQTYFLTPEEVQDVRQYTDILRTSTTRTPSQDADNSTEAGLSIPNYIYDGCKACFTAANETKAKASIFDDTGLMALTCRHDRVFFMVSFKDAGEKQYNALALLKALFKGLPSQWRVGMLYDIGCQIHRSIAKVCIQEHIPHMLDSMLRLLSSAPLFS